MPQSALHCRSISVRKKLISNIVQMLRRFLIPAFNLQVCIILFVVITFRLFGQFAILLRCSKTRFSALFQSCFPLCLTTATTTTSCFTRWRWRHSRTSPRRRSTRLWWPKVSAGTKRFGGTSRSTCNAWDMYYWVKALYRYSVTLHPNYMSCIKLLLYQWF